ncbi:MAG TPA: MerR family DNA-binding transcriptional regulator [Albitalea sp.]|nr:MerR family DNA-binding transcriptional regulator [Albitalea sp.]HJW11184.1 MerR family DNA-binding transcriptional regulator [Albitalea sp.]
MRIGELANRTGVAASAIRFYEASGLLPAATRGANGYRDYAESAAQQLMIIQLAQRLGFPLDALRRVLTRPDGLPHDEILERLTGRLAEIEEMQATLAAQREEVASLIRTLRAHWSAGECLSLPALVDPRERPKKRRVGKHG